MQRRPRPTKASPSLSSLFSNMTTAQQSILENDYSPNKHSNNPSTLIPQSQKIQYEEQEQIQPTNLSQSQKMALLVNKLIAKNVPLQSNIENKCKKCILGATHPSQRHQRLHRQICMKIDTRNDSSWKKLSANLQNNNKIYGYRVDAIHHYTYRVLQSITRTQRNQNQQNQGYSQQNNNNNYLTDSNTNINTNTYTNTNTRWAEGDDQFIYRFIQRNYKSINIGRLDAFFNVNPILQKTKRIFDHSGVKGLLLNSLDLDSELSLKILSQLPLAVHTDYKEQDMLSFQMEGMDGGCQCGIFRKIAQVSRVVTDSSGEVKQEEDQMGQYLNHLDNLQLEYKQRKRYQKSMNKSMQNQRQNLNDMVKLQQRHVSVNNTPQEHQNDQNQQQIPQFNTNPQLQHPPLPQPELAIPLQISVSILQPIPTSPQASSLIISTSQPLTLKQSSISLMRPPKHSYHSDMILRQLQTCQPQPTHDALLKWTNRQSKPKIKRQKKIKIQLPQPNPFQDIVSENRRKKVLKVDKRFKKEMKRLMKSIKVGEYGERNIVMNMSRWKINLALQTHLKDTNFNQNNNINAINVDLSNSDLSALLLKSATRLTIRQIKGRIRSWIQQDQSYTFSGVYGLLWEQGQNVTPAICFLTVLHVANEEGWKLVEKEGEYDFQIVKQQRQVQVIE